VQNLQILVAHERAVIGQAIRRVLTAQGFRVQVVADGDAVAAALRAAAWDALVLDVALPGPPLHALVELARQHAAGHEPVRAIVLVASVFRRTSYRRKPQQLYGADDYVEIHHLGDQLPSKLWKLLAADPSGISGMLEAEAVLATLQADAGDPPAQDDAAARSARLAELIVADVVLYAGDRLLAAESPAQAREALADDLAGARGLYRSVAGDVPAGADPIGDAFDALVRSLGGPPGGAAS
jgi:CheY-like chemotaxis protein